MESVNPNNRNYAAVVEDALSTNANRMNKAAAGAAKVVASTEDELIQVFSHKAGDQLSDSLKKIAQKYGFKVDAKTGELTGSIEGLQLVVRSKYQAAQQMISNLSNFMSNISQLIGRIGRDFRLG